MKLQKILPNSSIKNPRLRKDAGISPFIKTAIHHWHQSGGDIFKAWLELLTETECNEVRVTLAIGISYWVEHFNGIKSGITQHEFIWAEIIQNLRKNPPIIEGSKIQELATKFAVSRRNPVNDSARNFFSKKDDIIISEDAYYTVRYGKSKFRPCPFCGNTSIIIAGFRNTQSGNAVMSVYCAFNHECHASITTCVKDNKAELKKAQKELTDKWNGRVAGNTGVKPKKKNEKK